MSRLWEKIFRSLGLSPTWWRWRWINFRNRLGSRLSTDGNAVKHLRSDQKVCRNCGAIAGPRDRVCAVCGARLPSAAANVLFKVFGLILPGVAPATAVVIAAVGIDFLVQVAGSKGAALLTPSLESLLRAGALDSRFVAAGQWWRLLTCIFVHIGIIHFLFNSYALLSVSSFLEEEIGAARYLAVFLLTGLAGSAASYLLRFQVVSAGASGAIFGLIGFAITHFRRQGSARGREIRGFMIRWAVYAFFFGFLVRADNLAHAGGFAAGLLLGSIMETREDVRRRRRPVWTAMAAILSAALLFGFYSLVRSR